MGGRLARVFRTFNVESRARREISREKPRPAPRHSTSRLDELPDHPGIKEAIYRKDDRLLTLLKDVYVQSRDSPVRASGWLARLLQRHRRLQDIFHRVFRRDLNYCRSMDGVEDKDIDVLVESLTAEVKDGDGEHLPHKQEEKRLTKLGHLGDADVKKVSKGKISIVEALTLLNNHKLNPQIWTAEKIAVEYSLELKDVNSLLEFFIPFIVQEFPKETKKAIKST